MKKWWQEVCCSLGFHSWVRHHVWAGESDTYRACEHCWMVHLGDLMR